MKYILIVIAVLLCLNLAVHFVPPVHAQGSVTNAPYAFSPIATHTNCPAPTTGQTWYCYATDGAFQSINGAAYAPMVAAPVAGGVTSFNGRTGAVVSAANDYSFAQLSSPPTSFACPTGGVSSGSTGSGNTGSNCMFK